MSDAIAHRGPDGEGEHIGDGISFAHRRLSILELSESGAQPMHSPDGRVVLCFNGEIYNFLELRNVLIDLGHRFHGRSDTEVVLAAYSEWGLVGLEKLEGMFAIALWDTKSSTLILFRDRLGIKPLFYSYTGGRLIFGSEIKSVLASQLVASTLDQQAISEYLWFGNSHEDRTVYSDVKALEPGQRLIWTRGSVHVERWWRLEDWLPAPGCPQFSGDAVELIRGAIDQAVARQLVADVPVGLFLSGGLDSSAIAASAARTDAGRGLHAYSAWFGGTGEVDERPRAKSVADFLGMSLEFVSVPAINVCEMVEKMVAAHDEPFADAANVPLYALSSQVANKTKVVLQGDGGDEIFGGYRRYQLLANESILRRVPLGVHCGRLISANNYLRRLARVASTLRIDDPGLKMAYLLTTDSSIGATVDYLRPDAASAMFAATDPFLAYRNAASRFCSLDAVAMMMCADLTVQLPSQFLPKVDRATMAASVEARVPLLDEIVCKAALSLPTSVKVKGRKSKVVLRKALVGRIPARVANAPKTGFGVPYGRWLVGPLRPLAESALCSRSFLEIFQLDGAKIRDGLSALGRDPNRDPYQLWKLTQLALWTKRFADGPATS